MDGQAQPAVNVDQTRAWDGADGDNWTDNEQLFNDAVRFLTPVLLGGAALSSSDRVLDIGCGTGQTTRLAARAAASAFGIDLSSRMIERARTRSREEGLSNVTFERGDAQVYPFERSAFTVAISRFGSTFFDDAVRGYANIGAALGPGARLAMLCWRELARNEWVSTLRSSLAAGRELPAPPPHVPSPFAFADPARAAEVLEAAGFADVTLEPVEEPMFVGHDAEAAFERVQRMNVVRGLLTDLDDATRRRALETLRRRLAEHATPEGVLLGSSSWLVRATKAR